MNQLILNIGLNIGDVNNEAHKAMSLYKARILFENYPFLLSILDTEKENSNWGDEQVLVIRVEDITLSPRMTDKLIQLCIDLKQDAIALMYNDKGMMLFNPNYTGEKYEFNGDFFKKI